MNNLGRGSDNNQQKSNGIFTRETGGFVLILFSVISLIILISRKVIFGNIGFAVSSFLLGTFGYCSYAVLAALIYGGIVLLIGKKKSASRRRVALGVLLFLFLVCLVHTVTAQIGNIPYDTYGEYLSACYYAGENSFFQTTGGGAVVGLIVYPVVKLTTAIGGYIIFSILILGTSYLIYLTEHWSNNTKANQQTKKSEETGAYATSDTSSLYSLGYAQAAEQKKETFGAQTYPSESASQAEYSSQQPMNVAEETTARSKRLYAIGDEFGFKTKREMRQETRREEENRQTRVQQPIEKPISPYAEGRKILYPNSEKQDSYRWYNERFGSSVSTSTKKADTSSEDNKPYNSYTSNGIFNKDSYFNNPNRAEMSYKQYSDNFKIPGASNFTDGHELHSERTVPPQVSEPAPKAEDTTKTYSDMYADASETNISYSVRPKKIVTDTTQSGSSVQANNVYRKDVPTDFSSTQGKTDSFAESKNLNSRLNEQSSRSSIISPNSADSRIAHSEESKKTDDGFSEVMRRSGFGSLRSTRSTERPETSRESQLEQSETDSAENGLGRRSSDIPMGFAPSSAEESREHTESSDLESRNACVTPSADESRLEYPRRRTEETSGLKPIEENLDSVSNLFDDEPKESSVPDAADRLRSERRSVESSTEEPIRRRQIEQPTEEPIRRRAEMSQPPVQENKTEPERQKHIYERYNPPPLDLLKEYPTASVDSDEIEENKEIIAETLQCFKIPCEVVRVTQGPSVTRYDIEVPGNIPIQKVLSCDKELAMHLHARDGVNIQPNYENGAVSIEVPNRHRATVGLKEILQSDKFVNAKSGSLMFGLGKDIEGRSVCGDIKKMKHLLVAGATGSGKSICLHALIISLLYRYSPEELRFIFIDPKQVEFNIYDKLPHLMINEIVSDPGKVVTILDWLIAEMERRYSLFKEKTKKGTLVREIDDYNENLTQDEEKIPKIILVIDELADLMSVSKKELEDRIQRLTQKSRAAGIHLVLATQRPSVDVITGVIKTNLPTRIALKLTQEVDSRTILDGSGAEKLLGYGDLLYRTDSMNFASRVQGAFVSIDELQNIAQYIKENNEAYFDDRVSDYINNAKNHVGGGDGNGDDMQVEAVYIDALRYVVSVGQASISMIQRRCSVGYPKAGKIVEWMENMGYVSEFDGAKARKVLLSQEEFDKTYGDFGD